MPNKSQFIDMLADRLDGDRKRAAAALDAVIDSVYATISRGEQVAIAGFGVFERRDRAARTARNPATGQQVSVAATRVPAFRPGSEFKAIASGAKEFVETQRTTAQSALDRATEAVRDAPARAAAAVRDAQDRATATVNDAVDAVLDAASAVTGKPSKKDRKSAQKTAKKPAQQVQSASAPAKKTAKKAAKKSAQKATATKSAAKKTAKKAAKKSAQKANATRSAAKKTAKKAAKKSPAKKSAGKKSPAKKAAKKSG